MQGAPSRFLHLSFNGGNKKVQRKDFNEFQWKQHSGKFQEFFGEDKQQLQNDDPDYMA